MFGYFKDKTKGHFPTKLRFPRVGVGQYVNEYNCF